eukprot:3189659-Ditylum_brightwellii.AAC.1
MVTKHRKEKHPKIEASMLNISDYNAINSPSKLYNAGSSRIIPLDSLYYDPKKERLIEDILLNELEVLNTQEEKDAYTKNHTEKHIETKNLPQKYTQDHTGSSKERWKHQNKQRDCVILLPTRKGNSQQIIFTDHYTELEKTLGKSQGWSKMFVIKFMKLHKMTYNQSAPEQKVLQYDSFSRYIAYCKSTHVCNLMNGNENKTDKALLPVDYYTHVFQSLESYSGSTKTDS